jgi:hypothetical protein
MVGLKTTTRVVVVLSLAKKRGGEGSGGDAMEKPKDLPGACGRTGVRARMSNQERKPMKIERIDLRKERPLPALITLRKVCRQAGIKLRDEAAELSRRGQAAELVSKGDVL